MDVYLKEDLPERFHYKNNDRITSIVIVAHPGYYVYSVSYAIYLRNKFFKQTQNLF